MADAAFGRERKRRLCRRLGLRRRARVTRQIFAREQKALTSIGLRFFPNIRPIHALQDPERGLKFVASCVADVRIPTVSLSVVRGNVPSFQVSVTLAELGLVSPTGYVVTDLFDGANYGVVEPPKRFEVDVNPSGVVLVRCEVISQPRRGLSFADSINSVFSSFQSNRRSI